MEMVMIVEQLGSGFKRINSLCRDAEIKYSYEFSDNGFTFILFALIDGIQVYEEEQANGQWMKSIGFKLPIIDGEMDLSLDNDSRVKTVALLSKGEIDSKKYLLLNNVCSYELKLSLIENFIHTLTFNI